VARGLYLGRPGENVVNETSNTLPGSNLAAGAAAAMSVVVKKGVFLMNINGGSIAQANVGAPCYVVDDNTVDLTDDTNDRPCAGRIVGIESATTCWVDTTDQAATAT